MNQEVLNHLDELAQTVKDISPIVWEAYMKQQYIVASLSIILFILAHSVLIFIISQMKKHSQKSNTHSTLREAYIFIILPLGTVSSIASVLFLLIEGIPRLLNPTYYAIKALIG